MFNRYFQQELSNLRELAVEFSRAFPALAPMLEGPTTDPDVERLLEGVAFLTGLVREKIDDEFPEIVQGLIQMAFPHYLRPVPASTIIAFTPKPSMKESFKVPKGVEIASQPLEDTACRFKTCYEVEAHPLRLKAAFFDQPAGRPPTISLALELVGPDLSTWQTQSLRFHLAQDYPTAANLYYMLFHYLQNVIIRPAEGGAPLVLGPDHLRAVGFTEDEAVLPYPPQSFPGYRYLQEYFVLASKFLFFDLTGLDAWKDRGSGTRFDIIFEFRDLPFPAPKVKRENFVLFATPAINLFSIDADPILLDHRRNEYRVGIAGAKREHFQVYSVDKVVGYQQGSVRAREYRSFDLFHSQTAESPIHHVAFRKSPVGNVIDAYLSFTYPPKTVPVPETLSISVTCTNGELADRFQIGDISRSTATSPELLEYRNIRPPTASILPPLGKTMLWRFLSLYSLNYFSLAQADNLKALLKLYIFTESRDQASTYANMRRVDGITGLSVASVDRLVRGHMMRGQDLKISVAGDHFASEGDLFLFNVILDRFFASYVTLNSFTRLSMEEVLKGDKITWPARLGNQRLI
jgi:type VI secretion system protein ImpG